MLFHAKPLPSHNVFIQYYVFSIPLSLLSLVMRLSICVFWSSANRQCDFSLTTSVCLVFWRSECSQLNCVLHWSCRYLLGHSLSLSYNNVVLVDILLANLFKFLLKLSKFYRLIWWEFVLLYIRLWFGPSYIVLLQSWISFTCSFDLASSVLSLCSIFLLFKRHFLSYFDCMCSFDVLASYLSVEHYYLEPSLLY